MEKITKKNLSYLLIALLMGTFLTLGINELELNLEHYFFAKELDSEQMTAQLVTASEPEFERPEKFEVELNANAALSVWTDLEQSKVLFEKNKDRTFPIASLSKLMTSFVVMDLGETYPLEKPIMITEKSVEQDGNFDLKPGERLSVKDLMAMALIESSNDAAYALSDYIGKDSFVELMNYYVDKMSLEDTKFYNPTGLKVEEKPENKSSAENLAKLAEQILKKHPEIFELSQETTYKVKDSSESLHHRIEENTNILLEDYPKMIGGKTGYTDGADQCLLTIMKGERGYYINVILGSNDRFGEMEKLIEKTQ